MRLSGPNGALETPVDRLDDHMALKRIAAPSIAADLDDLDVERLEALDRYDLLDTPPEPQFDRIVRLTKDIFDIPMAVVSVIDGHRQWYKASEGLAGTEVPVRDTFCRYTILDAEPLVIPDAAKDGRFAENPTVTTAPHIRFYAGAPLTTPDGHNIGTVCALDTKPREFDEREKRILETLAEMVMHELELRRCINIDVLTQALSRRAFAEAAQKAVAHAFRHDHKLSCVVFDIDRFKAINDTYGHAAGDVVLAGVAKACRERLRESDLIGRIGGEEFAVLLAHADAAEAHHVAEELREAIQKLDFEVGSRRIGATASFGVAEKVFSTPDFGTLVARADTAMYAAKRDGRNRCSVWRGQGASNQDVRRRVLKAGRIVDRDTTTDCTVRSLSRHGAGLDVSSVTGLPDQFSLAITADRFETRCRVISRTDRHLEVEFC
jgi:diguanylate cyclase (GGDEF)-like protein